MLPGEELTAAELVFIEQLRLSPEQKLVTTLALTCLHAFCEMCTEAGISMSDLTPEFLIAHFTGREPAPTALGDLERELSALPHDDFAEELRMIKRIGRRAPALRD